MTDKKKSRIKRISRFGVLIFIILSLIPFFALAQSNLPVLGWRTHFSYNNVVAIANSDDRIFAATDNAIFYVEQDENSINFINKNTGLSDVGIGALAYDQDNNRLVIAYQNGNIDFWSDGVITNIKTVKDSEIAGSKRLRDVQVFQNKLYISGDLGIVVFDQSRNEISETYRNLGPNGESLTIYQTAFTNDSIFAVSESGILSASLAESINRQDFNNWSRTLTGLPFQQITQFDGNIFASSDTDLFTYQTNEWMFDKNFPSPIQTLQLINQEILYILTSDALWVQGDPLGLRTLYSAQINEGLNKSLLVPGGVFIGSSNQGLLQFNTFNVPPNSVLPAGPTSDSVSKPVAYENNVHWISASGSISSFSLENQVWTSQRTRDLDGNRIQNLTDIDFGLVSDPNIDAPIFSSFEKGLFFGGDNLNGSINVIEDFSNTSPLARLNGSYNVSSIAPESSGQLWITTTDFTNSLHSWTVATDEWESYGLSNFSGRFVSDIFIAPNGNKWLSIDPDRGGGIVVFDETTLRERYLITNGGQGGLPGSEVTSMAIDDDQFLWVGTNAGIAFFPNPSIILENQSLTANVPIFENRLLLRDEFITQIVIDPANRKWFGTRNNGLWLFSETGEELVYHFTTENSPLPSNNIISLYLDPPSGEVFIGTENGMVSFRSDATEGTDQHVNVKIYPNPVNPSFQGEIVINGLANNALLKVTDVSGKLVREVRANGSTALWNARDIQNRRVSSGVYLVFSSSADGMETFVGKIVVI